MSDEDQKVVMHVLSKKEDYYAVLNIQKSATEDEVKRAYKKMALKLHPDKNKHAKAEEAFKHVSTAHTTLADKEKRRIYDRHGASGVQAHESGASPGGHGGGGGGARYQQYHFGGGGGGFENDLFEEIFSMFLDPRMAQQRQRQQQQQYYQYQQQQQRARQQQRHHHQQGHEFGGNPLIAFAPLLLFFIFAILLQSSSVFDVSGSRSVSNTGGNPSGSGSGGGLWGSAADRRSAQERNFRRTLFSLSKTNEHPQERVTASLPDDLSDLQVPYFVNHNFEYTLSRYGQRLRSVELEVVRSKKESLERRCANDIKRGNHHSRSQACRDLEKFRKVPV